MSAVTTYGTSLLWGESLESATKVVDIKSFPDLGGDPEEHDVSTFINKFKVSIPGRQQLDALEFGYFIDDDMANYKAVVSSSNKKLHYKIQFGLNGAVGAFTWQGSHVTRINGADGDAPLEGTLKVFPTTDISMVE